MSVNLRQSEHSGCSNSCPERWAVVTSAGADGSRVNYQTTKHEVHRDAKTQFSSLDEHSPNINCSGLRERVYLAISGIQHAETTSGPSWPAQYLMRVVHGGQVCFHGHRTRGISDSTAIFDARLTGGGGSAAHHPTRWRNADAQRLFGRPCLASQPTLMKVASQGPQGTEQVQCHHRPTNRNSSRVAAESFHV